MEAKDGKNSVPLKPYDDSMWDQWKLYDSLPYTWDTNLIVERRFVKESGNIVKSYRCQLKEPYEIKH